MGLTNHTEMAATTAPLQKDITGLSSKGPLTTQHAAFLQQQGTLPGVTGVALRLTASSPPLAAASLKAVLRDQIILSFPACSGANGNRLLRILAGYLCQQVGCHWLLDQNTGRWQTFQGYCHWTKKAVVMPWCYAVNSPAIWLKPLP